jgi:hypothetical protein
MPSYSNKLIDNTRKFGGNNNLLKNITDIKKIEQIAERDRIKESVIKPIKLGNNNKQELETKFTEEQKTYMPKIKEYWQGRTNQPYKGIIGNAANKEFKTEADLLVHRVTSADKQGVDNELEKYKGAKDTHDSELKKIFHETNKADHIKKFEYNHKYKFRITTDSAGHDDLKNDRLAYYRREQQKQEEDKEKMDNVVEDLINQNIVDKDKVNKYLSRQYKQ